METFIIAILYILAGLAGFALSLVLRFRPLIPLYYSSFAASIGVWTLSISAGRELIYSGPWRSIELVSFFAMPLALGLFFNALFGNGFKNLVQRIWQYYAILSVSALTYVLAFSGKLESLLRIYQISLMASITLWMLAIIPTIPENRKNLSVIVGASFMGVTGVIDVLFAMGVFKGNVHLVHFGVLAFFLVLTARLVSAIMDFIFHEALLRKIAAGTTGTGEEFFQSLVREMAGAFSARYAIVGELTRFPELEVQTLAVWSGGRLIENFRYNAREIPSEQLSSDSIQSHFGIPLANKDGEHIGVLSVLHDQVLQKTGYARTIMEVFAARAASEIQRTHQEGQIQYTQGDSVSDSGLFCLRRDGRGRITRN